MGLELINQKATFYIKDKNGEYKKIGTAENAELKTEPVLEIQSVKESESRNNKVYSYNSIYLTDSL